MTRPSLLFPLMILAFLILGGTGLADVEGWVPLFDGKTLDGWKVNGGNARYEVEGGEIVGTTVEGSPNTFLCKGDYQDFALELEVKCDPALNSGIQVRDGWKCEVIQQAVREAVAGGASAVPVGISSGVFAQAESDRAAVEVPEEEGVPALASDVQGMAGWGGGSTGSTYQERTGKRGIDPPPTRPIYQRYCHKPGRLDLSRRTVGVNLI